MHVLIVGFGSIGRRHAKNLRALCDPLRLTLLRREERSDNSSETLGATVVRGLDQALAARPDCAVVANPSSQHTDVLLPLLEAGIPCYIEKPVVTRLEDANRVREALRHIRNIPVTLVGCNLRFLPSLRALHALIEQGKIGRVVRASIQAGQWLPDWRPAVDYRTSYSADAALGGGVILDLIHEVDAARWLFGEFDRVLALAGKLSSLEIRTEDTACLLLGRNGTGPVVSVALDYVSRRPIRHYEVVGEQGTAVWDLGRARLEIVHRDDATTVECGADGFDVAKTYVSAMGHFLECVRENTVSSQDVFEGLRSAELALRARNSAGL